MAPEIIQREHDYDPRCVDVWSCAIVYLSLYFVGTPWDVASMDNNNYAVFKRNWDEWLEDRPGEKGIVQRGGPLPTLAYTSKKFRLPQTALSMIFGMLHPDPERRWKIREAVDVVSDRDPKKGGPWPCCRKRSTRCTGRKGTTAPPAAGSPASNCGYRCC